MKHIATILILLATFATSFAQNVVKLKAKDLAAGQIIVADTMENGVIRFVTKQLSTAATDAGFVLSDGSKGELYIDNTDRDTITVVSGTPDSLNEAFPGYLANFTATASSLVYTGTATKAFTITFSLSATTTGTNHTLSAWIYHNGAKITKSIALERIGTGTEQEHMGSSCVLELAPGDYITVAFDASASVDVYVSALNLIVSE